MVKNGEFLSKSCMLYGFPKNTILWNTINKFLFAWKIEKKIKLSNFFSFYLVLSTENNSDCDSTAVSLLKKIELKGQFIKYTLNKLHTFNVLHF